VVRLYKPPSPIKELHTNIKDENLTQNFILRRTFHHGHALLTRIILYLYCYLHENAPETVRQLVSYSNSTQVGSDVVEALETDAGFSIVVRMITNRFPVWNRSSTPNIRSLIDILILTHGW
jgi:hypothetical protein